MEFLKECAKLLHDTGDVSAVIANMEARYSTPRCLNVKMSLVRKLYSTEYAGAAPPKDFCITKDQRRACKRLARVATLQKNKFSLRVDGARLLASCRQEVDRAFYGEAPTLTLALSLMLLTGRRTCEILNAAQGVFSQKGPYSLSFSGQAKKKSPEGKEAPLEYEIPVLHDADRVLFAIERMSSFVTPAREKKGVSRNQMLSQKYQSQLRKTLLAHPVLREAGKVHALRGVYAKIAVRLFEWEGGYSEAFIVMTILGHAGLQESLVYTPFNVVNLPAQGLLGPMTPDRKESDPI